MNVMRHEDAGVADGVLLAGLDGSNPLGFMAALGTLQVLIDAAPPQCVTLAWRRLNGSWNPLIRGAGIEPQSIIPTIAQELNCPFKPDEFKDREREQKQAAFDSKRSELKKAIELLKKRGLRGKERSEAEAEVLAPIRDELAKNRAEWLAALRESVPTEEMSLGKHLNASCSELRDSMLNAMAMASISNRGSLDMLAAFGSDVCSQPKSYQMQATPLCFITGSGHQYFLDTARQLFEKVDEERLERALNHPGMLMDETLSMRWDPQEDRRYAVMWSDPTSSDNKAKTNWAMNLLAYQGMRLLPSAPVGSNLVSTGWIRGDAFAWRWPIWTGCLTVDLIRSVLSHPILKSNQVDIQTAKALGIQAVFQSERIQVGNPPLHKINFTPAVAIL